AYVYVSSRTTTAAQQSIHAYAANPYGTLTTVQGSPFTGHALTTMTLNGKWLFTSDGVRIYSRLIRANGSLGSGLYVNAQRRNEYPTDGGPTNLVLDRTGASLYDGDIYIDGANNGYQAWNVNWASGAFTFKGNVPPYSTEFGAPLSFTANNVYAYSAACDHGSPEIYGYRRASDGTLSAIHAQAAIPVSPISGTEYCPYLAAADTANHIAVTLTPFEPYANAGPPQIAVYTVQADGTLTTASTATNMPKSAVVTVTDMKMSPSGKLLAVSGTAGLQIFHWNGGSPATAYTGLVVKYPIDEMVWDTHNHLYAISRAAGRLYVLTITPTFVAHASGSPHAIARPLHVTVVSK
ncbi:MAG TPA: hypothetical protein VL382_05100, partial [Terriglobales bacterium]|nr:hypothetical protein [Terriglobales bacterium]